MHRQLLLNISGTGYFCKLVMSGIKCSVGVYKVFSYLVSQFAFNVKRPVGQLRKAITASTAHCSLHPPSNCNCSAAIHPSDRAENNMKAMKVGK